MARVVWDRQAFDDLDDIIRFIEQFDPDAADRIGSRLYELGKSLVDFPQRGRPLSDGMREMATVSPYILRYRVVEEQVKILTIRHGRPRPI